MEIRSISSIAATRPVASPPAPPTEPTPAEPAVAASTTPDASERAARTPGGFISPVLRYDQMAHVAVLFFRDFDSGETRDQIPAERVVEEYRRNAQRVNGDQDHPSNRMGQTAAVKTGDAPTKDGTSAAASGGAGGSATGFTFAQTAGAPDAAAALAFSASPSSAYAAAPASAGNGAAVSFGATGGGAPGGLVSVTV